MSRLEELLGYKAKFENELLFAKARVSVIDEMIADEKAKVVEKPIAEEVAIEENAFVSSDL